MSDNLEPLVEALQRKVNAQRERINDLEAENDELKDRIARIEQLIEPDRTRTDYDELTKDRKVFRIRSRLVEVAQNTNGKASMDYNDVRTEFGGHPSPGHCYDLMRVAGDLDGFDYQEKHDKANRVVVELDAVNEPRSFHAANKAESHKSV